MAIENILYLFVFKTWTFMPNSRKLYRKWKDKIGHRMNRDRRGQKQEKIPPQLIFNNPRPSIKPGSAPDPKIRHIQGFYNW